MATLHLEFEGYYQMRMATDPDPPDDPRGLSGYTFALPGEPDFDRKLHFQSDEKGAWQRVYGPPGTPGPQIGVRITQAREGNHVHSHLIGARVRFVQAELVERNGVVVRNDLFAIDPLLVRIEAQARAGDEFKPVVERLDLLDPQRPQLTLLEATADQLRRRQLQGGFTDNSEVVARATGLPNPSNDELVRNREQRQKTLIALRDRTDPNRDPDAYAGLTTRIQQLDMLQSWWELSMKPKQRAPDRRARQLALLAEGWKIGLNGPVKHNTIGADESEPWELSFWLGGWDGDALCGYIKGALEIPLNSRQK